MRRMLQGITGLVLAGGLFGLTSCVGPPTVIRVTTTADVVANDGLRSLREAFALANQEGNANTIVLGSEVYDLTNCAAGALVHTRRSSLTIVANGATIRQRCLDDGILASIQPSSALVLNDVDLVGGPGSGVARNGAAINVRGALTMRDSAVTGVDAGRAGSVIDVTGGTAAEDVYLYFTNIRDNIGNGIVLRSGAMRGQFVVSGGNDGDGIRLLGSSRLTGDFISAIDNVGWGLNAIGSGDTVVDTLDASFSRNAFGGVSCFGCSEASIQEAHIFDNGAFSRQGDGGGISFVPIQRTTDRVPFLQLFRSTIRGNASQRHGGGVFSGLADGSDPGVTGPAVYLHEARIEGNRTNGDGRNGGGVAITAGTVHTGTTRITGNTTSGRGGGLYHVGNDRGIELSDVTFAANASGEDGGGLYIETDQAVAISALVEGNSGSSGGGAYIWAGGGIDIGGRWLENTSRGEGGALYLNGDAMVRNALVQGNEAGAGGGIMAVNAALVRVERSTFAMNTAGFGGGLHVETGRLELDHSTVTGNAVAGRGGGLSLNGASVSLSFTTVVDNAAENGAPSLLIIGELETFGSLLVGPTGEPSCELNASAPRGHSFVSDTSCGVHPTDTVFAGDPQLGPLDGGVRAPEPDSPVGGTVPVDVCLGLVDQLGVSRPQGTACEPGSVEIEESGPARNAR